MTNTNTIQSFKRIANELNAIKCDNYTDTNYFSYHDLKMLKSTVCYIIDSLEEKYHIEYRYRCLSCGKIITETEYADELANERMGMCWCESDNGILNPYVKEKINEDVEVDIIQSAISTNYIKNGSIIESLFDWQNDIEYTIVGD